MKRLALVLLLGSALVGPAAAVVTSTPVGNANYTALSTDQRLLLSVAFTAQRTITLPPAGATCIGQTCPASALEIVDPAGTSINGANTLVIAPATGDTINGSSSSITVTGIGAGGRLLLIPFSGTNWVASFLGQGQIIGTTTNDNACTGCVGEYITATVTSAGGGSAPAGGVSLVTATGEGVTQVLLTPGDWDCRGNVLFNASAGTSITSLTAWTSTTSATLNTFGLGSNGSDNVFQTAALTGAKFELLVGAARYSLAAATSVYLNAGSIFTVGQNNAQGFLGCRRAR